MKQNEVYKKILVKFKKSSVQNPITLSLIGDAIAKREPDVHKGNCGRLLVCAGSEGMTGAAAMAVMSSLRCGCGLVTLACPRELNTIFEIKLTEAMTLPLPSENGKITYRSIEVLSKQLKKCDTLLIGPGLGKGKDIDRLINEILQTSEVPVILDADGINAICSDASVLKNAKCPIILTPHIGEFSRLTKNDADYIVRNQEMMASDFACQYGCVVVLKSHSTVVATADAKTYINILGNPGMATGGSGDVLAGAIASFLSQKRSPELSALAGVYLHSLAADMAAEETGEYSLLPSDIINYMMCAIKESQHHLYTKEPN